MRALMFALFVPGRSRSKEESYTEKVVTYSEEEKFAFTHFLETSPPNINLDGSRATRVGSYSLGYWVCFCFFLYTALL